MVNVKEYFETDYWTDYEWYSFGNLRYQFFRDVFGFKPFDRTFKDKAKSILGKIKKSPVKFVKDFIYYLPACLYMIKAFFVVKYREIVLKEPFYTRWL